MFHVFARGNDKRLIYRDDVDRHTYLRMLRATAKQRRWRMFAYCLMENHVHLLVETPEANLGQGIQRLHSLYAREFNSRHRRSGHLFQGRYGAVPIKTDGQLWTVAMYIAMNPVTAGLCAEPEEWRWSSHSAVMSGSAHDWLNVPRLVSYFGNTAAIQGAATPRCFAARSPIAPRGPGTPRSSRSEAAQRWMPARVMRCRVRARFVPRRPAQGCGPFAHGCQPSVPYWLRRKAFSSPRCSPHAYRVGP